MKKTRKKTRKLIRIRTNVRAGNWQNDNGGNGASFNWR